MILLLMRSERLLRSLSVQLRLPLQHPALALRRHLLALRSPPRLLLLPSLAASPAAAGFARARRLTYSPVSLAFSASLSTVPAFLRGRSDCENLSNP